MLDINLIDKKFLQKHHFDKIDYEQTYNKANYRIKPGDIIPDSDKEKLTKLRGKIRDLFARTFARESGRIDYGEVQLKTGVSYETIKKFLAGKTNISRPVLGGIVIGAKLSLDEANELFILHGHSLDPENVLLDCIIHCAIRDNDDYWEYLDICDHYKVDTKRTHKEWK